MTMTNEQLAEAVKLIAWLDSKICEAIAAIDAGYSERKDIEWQRAEANLCDEARAMAKIIDQLWDEREEHLRIIRNQEAVMVEQEATIEQQRTELRDALYPNGIKHPDQAKWYWLIERAKEQREALVALWDAAYEHWDRTESCGSCCNLDSLDKLSKVLDDVLPYVKEEV